MNTNTNTNTPERNEWGDGGGDRGDGERRTRLVFGEFQRH